MTNEELNQAIYAEVFGQCRHKFRRGICAMCRVRHIYQSAVFPTGRFSTNIADAFLVVDEMERRNFQWLFSRTDRIKSVFDNRPTVDFWTYDNGRLSRSGRATSNTLARAICLAALEAVRAEKENEVAK